MIFLKINLPRVVQINDLCNEVCKFLIGSSILKNLGHTASTLWQLCPCTCTSLQSPDR